MHDATAENVGTCRGHNPMLMIGWLGPQHSVQDLFIWLQMGFAISVEEVLMAGLFLLSEPQMARRISRCRMACRRIQAGPLGAASRG